MAGSSLRELCTAYIAVTSAAWLWFLIAQRSIFGMNVQA